MPMKNIVSIAVFASIVVIFVGAGEVETGVAADFGAGP
jgi:hypothetical protein